MSYVSLGQSSTDYAEGTQWAYDYRYPSASIPGLDIHQVSGVRTYVAHTDGTITYGPWQRLPSPMLVRAITQKEVVDGWLPSMAIMATGLSANPLWPKLQDRVSLINGNEGTFLATARAIRGDDKFRLSQGSWASGVWGPSTWVAGGGLNDWTRLSYPRPSQGTMAVPGKPWPPVVSAAPAPPPVIRPAPSGPWTGAVAAGTPKPADYQAVQILVTRDVPPSPGDGSTFATIMWRTAMVAWNNTITAATPWRRWVSGFVRRGNDPAMQVLFIDGVLYGAKNNAGAAAAFDLPGIQAALAASGPGTPPPASVPVVPPSQVFPAVPSGTILPINQPTPSLKPWVDVEVFPAVPSGTILPFMPSPVGPVQISPAGPGGGMIVPTKPVAIIDGGAVYDVNATPLPPENGGRLWLGVALVGVVLAYASSQRRRR